MENTIKDYGFHEDLVVIKPEDYKFGSGQLLGEVLQLDADWTDYLPMFEYQAKIYETSGCTAFGTLNCIEILHKRLFGIEPNYSDRFTYIKAGVTINGANPNNACESVRKDGVVDQEVLPMPDTYAEFNSPRPMTKSYEALGKKWLETHEVKHDWVLYGTPNNETLKEALKYSPIGVSVTAWMLDEDGLYIDNNMPNTHWCVLVKFDGDKPVVFDTYKKELKTLHPDHQIRFAKRYTLRAKKPTEEKHGIINWLKKLFSWLF